MRFQTGKPVRVVHSFVNDDETTYAPEGAVTFTVADIQGEPVDLTATPPVVGGAGTATPVAGGFLASIKPLPIGRYTVTFRADDFAEPVPIEVTGGVLFTPAEAREFDADLTVERVPPAALRRLRAEIEAEFERITERSFVRRVGVFPVDGYGQGAVWIGAYDAARLVGLYGPDGVDVAAGATLDADGVLSGLERLPEGAYRAVVEYGFETVPDDVRRAALLRLRSVAYEDTSGVPDRAVSFTPTEGGNFTLATAGRAGWETGVPDVDAVLGRYRRTVVSDVIGMG